MSVRFYPSLREFWENVCYDCHYYGDCPWGYRQGCDPHLTAEEKQPPLLGQCSDCWFGINDPSDCPEILGPDEVKDKFNPCRSFWPLEIQFKETNYEDN